MLASVASASARARTMAIRSPLGRVKPGALDGDVGARAHGDADIGRGEGRRVVDAVAGEGDLAAFDLQLGNEARLLLGQHTRIDALDAELARDGLRRLARVARRHDDLDAAARAARAARQRALA